MRLVHPEFKRVESGDGEPFDDASLHTGRIVPIHPLTAGVSPRWFRRLVHAVLEREADAAEEILPEAMRRRHALAPIAWALSQIHFPDDDDTREQARRRLVFEEFFILHAALAMRRARLTARAKPQRYQPDGVLAARFLRALPFAFTESQRRVLEELTHELCRPTPMLRLLQGDVGCGKTVVVASLMAIVVQSGYQVAVLAPTELLAQQHARVLQRYLKPLGVAVDLLAQSVGAAQRKDVIARLADGSLPIVIGTHALLEDGIRFKQLALVVIDEQHKFGVAQRTALIRKAAAPDVLVMTATPIPRTLALSRYGDLLASTITELPPGRTPVDTQWFPEAQRADAYALLRRELCRGRQGYVVYPLVHENEKLALKAATQMAKQLQVQVVPEHRVALLHGQMRAQDQDAASGMGLIFGP